MTSYRVRRYAARDAEAISQIFHRAIEGLAPNFYSAEQVAAWSARGADAKETDRRCSDGRMVWVATDDQDHAIAFIDIESNGHIDMLFCDPAHAGKGVASLLFKELEKHARATNIASLITEASAVAKPVFAHWGFEVEGRNDFDMGGVQIFNFTMVKRLAG